MDEKTLAVQRLQDYIAAHFAEPVTPPQLAEAAHFSPWYAARIFRELTGLAPADYLRLSKSTLRLRDEKLPVTAQPLCPTYPRFGRRLKRAHHWRSVEQDKAASDFRSAEQNHLPPCV